MINIKFDFFIKKTLHKKTIYYIIVLKSNDHVHGHIYDIICDNMPIFGTNVHLALTNNVAKVSFQFFA